MQSDTIAALSTPAGIGGIGIIRISGDSAVNIALKIFSRTAVKGPGSGGFTPLRWDPSMSHRLIHGYIIDPETRNVLDEVLLAVMKSPHSYTCEDIVEIQAHAGIVGLNEILKAVLKCGARIAEPGEFTKRAFLNGRIDLTQAEATAEIIQAKSEVALKMATSLIRGGLKDKIQQIRDALNHFHAALEADIEFGEEVQEPFDSKAALDVLNKSVVAPIQRLLSCYESAAVYRNGMHVVIVGKPNVGKSSLMNQLLQKNRAIVTPVPGTTRDAIEARLSIDRMPVTLVDTAGFHQTIDLVENIGMGKSREYIDEADIVLFVVDESGGIDEEDRRIFKMIKDKKGILVQNKKDIVNETYEMEIPAEWNIFKRVRASAKQNMGMEILKTTIKELALPKEGAVNHDEIVPNLRQKYALEKAMDSVKRVVAGLSENVSEDVVVLDIKETIQMLGTVVGDNASPDVLEEIFSNFCVGK